MTASARNHCEWCGREIESPPRGRRRKYCGHACRQRAYESRRGGRGVQPGEGVTMSQATADRLHDGLFELRCAAEDIHTAAVEKASHDDIKHMATELIELTRELDKLR
ncbi:hypothetical protein KRX51_06090 [Corynebacterium sp. TAE3-ERU12]|uniref:hypothetical protein n=1 Tax=Corynebacterium sp. TAE3-ERU12 TaxID=2849491 RepID=UPI001C461660|nr:hypothetical protein [Corynebacterium sp. TAE3-ERU12]MBV7295489.1 hypothetical protein [Corynebacterium sp. TAE3-ERU12]